MKIVDLTGDNRGVVSFHLDRSPDGTVSARFEVSKIDGTNFLPGQYVPVDAPSITELQIKFDKVESVAAFVETLGRGGNKLAFVKMQEKVRVDALDKAAKQEALKGRIEQMAKELSALQGEYAELKD